MWGERGGGRQRTEEGVLVSARGKGRRRARAYKFPTFGTQYERKCGREKKKSKRHLREDFVVGAPLLFGKKAGK